MKNETEELDDIPTELAPLYESVEELKMGHLLDPSGIPFCYKLATVV